MQKSRDRYLPETREEITRDGINAIVYLFERDGKVCAVGFEGKGEKPKFRYNWGSNAERRSAYINWFFGDVKQRQDKRAARVAERRANAAAFDASEHVKVGDIVTNSWGYDQTNIDYYVVVKVGKKFLTLRPCAAQKSGDMMQGTCVPLPEKLTGEPERHAAYICDYLNDKPVGVNFKHGAGRLWDGKPESWSSYH